MYSLSTPFPRYSLMAERLECDTLKKQLTQTREIRKGDLQRLCCLFLLWKRYCFDYTTYAQTNRMQIRIKPYTEEEGSHGEHQYAKKSRKFK